MFTPPHNLSSSFYSEKFYKDISLTSLAGAKRIVPFINFLFPCIKTVVDIGCGTGAFLSYFAKQGKYIKGYDFGEGLKNNLIIDKSNFIEQDLTKPIDVKEKVDLCISLEVAEHIDKNYEDIFILNLINFSDIILFSAAIPNQGGTNHINCQWPDHWGIIFSKYGYFCYDILRPIFWEDNEIPWWYRQNIMLFINNNSKVEIDKNYANLNCMRLIHPRKF